MISDGIMKYYELTPFGCKILDSSRNLTTSDASVGLGVVHVLEDHAVTFDILKAADPGRRRLALPSRL